ncbi:MAG TPA: response regulator [Thermoanaerobaculia bacterium]|jgi:CheY-like chemotaxis protein
MSRKCILVIDDDDDVREVAALALETAGDYDIVTAENGRAGLAQAFRSLPDLILLDVMMPELDGPATFRLLRQSVQTSNIPVIFLTAKVQPADRRNLTALGANGLIAKPFDPLMLAEQVSEIAAW